ncbi:MAG: penicillin acylase family protein [Xanthomonadales bacterium PRO7]|nr:penicillin acylase family protein [Xanthomonadales bacterium PRO7]
MKKQRRILRRTISTLVILVAALVFAAWLLLRGSLPQLGGAQTLAGIQAQVTIERDALGVVTIKAQSRDDAMYALGFVHAQERFFEMDLMRRMAAGELAELVGSAAIDTDKQHRPFRLRERTQGELETLAPDEHKTLSAYRDGVNAGLAALRSRPWEYWPLGEKPALWSDADSILAIDAMFFDLNGADNARETAFMQIKSALGENVYKFLSATGGPWDAPLTGPPMNYPALPNAADIDLRKLDPKLLHIPPEHAEKKTTPGSNGFAVNGALTSTHAALIADDMHLPLRVPNIWFRARIEYPNPRRAGQMVDLIGATLPGLPALVAGSNRRVAWGFTNSYGDWMDWVRVDLDPNDATRYKTAAGWKSIAQSTQIVKVHNAADVKLDVRDTQWGPILGKDSDGTPLALAWTAIEPGGVNMQFARMDTAETVDEAVDIANASGMPAQNFIVGDRSGNIAWTIAGKIPKREGACDPLLPCDWSTPSTGWNGWLVPADYPRLSNPPWQRIWTANARMLDWESPDYAKLGDGGYDFGARARQIRDDLKAKDQFTPDDMLAIQLDDRALLMKNWHELLGKVLAKAGDSAPFADMKKYTDDWNERADPASVGYRLAHDFRIEVIDTVLDGFAAAVRVKYPDFRLPKFGQAETLVDDILLHRPENLLPPGYTNWDDLLQKCAARVGDKLTAMPGGIAQRRWGEVTKTHIRHPLSVALPGMGWLLDMPSRELPGDINMPRVQASNFGASERFAVEPGHEEYGYFHMPGGQSDNPLSPFYGAGDAAWAQGKAKPFLPGETKYTLELRPLR